MALLLIVALGCQGPAPASSPTNAPAPPTTAPASKPASAPSAAPAPQGQPIKIGALVSTTGTLASYGNDFLPAVQIMVDEANASGGITGRPLQLIHFDDESKPDMSVSGVKRLIQQEKVSVIAGPVDTTVGAPDTPLLNEMKVPAVGCICDLGPITPYEFSVLPLAGNMVSLSGFAKSKGYTKVGIITLAGALAEIVKKIQVPPLEGQGMQVVGFEQFQPTDSDVTPLLSRLKAAGAQMVYAAASGAPSALVMKNFKQVNYPGTIWTYSGNATQAFIDLVGDAADIVNVGGTKILIYKQLPDSDPLKPALVAFAAKFKAKTGHEPGTFAALGHDAGLSIIEAIKKAGDDPLAIRDALETQTGLQGLNGVINRSATEHNGVQPEWLTIQIDPVAKVFTQR